MRPRVLVIYAVDVCHEEEIVRLHHSCGDGGEGVIVTEFVDLPNFLEKFSNADLEMEFCLTNRDSYSIVFIYYGDYSHIEKLTERILGIQILCTLLLHQPTICAVHI